MEPTQDRIHLELVLPYTREGTDVIYGNLLTLPVGESLLYVQPIYSVRTSGDGNYPILRFVSVSFGDNNVGVGTTLGEALADVLGVAAPEESVTEETDDGTEEGGETAPEASLEEQIRTLLSEADDLFAQANTALTEGDLGTYSDLNEQGQAKVAEALELAQDLPDSSASETAAPEAESSGS